MERPAFIKNEHLEYLDDLRDSGITNMFGARPYLLKEYGYLSKEEAGQVVTYWMKTFSERNK